MSRVHFILIGALVWIATSATVQAQNVIVDGSFESPVRADGSYTPLSLGADIGGAWFVTATVNDVGHVRHASYSATLFPYPDGDQMVYVGDSGSAATIAQPISSALTADPHLLSFYLGTVNHNDVATARVQLAPITSGSGAGTVYGVPVYDQTFTVGPTTPTVWHLVTDVVNVPAAGNYGLLISGLADGAQTHIDDVSFGLPEPSSAVVASIGIGFASLRRRQR